MHTILTVQYPSSYTAWDLETTGLDPLNDKIIEIGAMKVVDNKIIESRSWLLNHGVEIDEKITGITGITKEMIDKDGVNPQAAMTEFLSMMGDANLTHNGYRFDLPFLFAAMSAEYRQMWMSSIERGMIDSAVLYKALKLNMSRMWNESFADYAERVMDVRAYGVRYNVAICCSELAIDTSQATFHRALGDVALTNMIYQKLIHQL